MPPLISAIKAAEAQSPGGAVFAAAERIQQAAWSLRSRGVNRSTCREIHALACLILSTKSLRNRDDARAPSLRDALHMLERHIADLLDGPALDAPAAAAEPVLAPPPADTLAALAAMTDEERIAVFT